MPSQRGKLLREGMQVVSECVICAIGLGIAMDMVTAHVAVEYFTVHHPRLVDSNSPVVMALVWGFSATWWFGAAAGAVLALVNSRRAAPLAPAAVRMMMVRACAALWVAMMLILGTCYSLIGLLPIDHDETFETNRRLMSVAFTHLAEYALATMATVIVAVRLWRRPSSGSHPNGNAII